MAACTVYAQGIVSLES